MVIKKMMYFFMCALISTSISVVCMEEPTKFNPQNTKFAFDLHGVIVTDPFSCLGDLKKALDWNAIPACNTQLPWFAYDILKLILYKPSGESFRYLCSQHEQHDFVTYMMDFTNNVNLLPGTIAILKELREKGYELDLASNVDTVFLQDLENNNKYPDIQDVLALFTNKKAIDWGVIHVDWDNQVYKTFGPIKKPDVRYFNEYQEEHNRDNKQVIFIDDNEKNVSASNQADMIGIHFQNPEQLRSELVQYGILEK